MLEKQSRPQVAQDRQVVATRSMHNAAAYLPWCRIDAGRPPRLQLRPEQRLGPIVQTGAAAYATAEAMRQAADSRRPASG